jgi:hypothetical protein
MTKKRKFSNIILQQIAVVWSMGFSYLRSIENFLYYFRAFKYTFAGVNFLFTLNKLNQLPPELRGNIHITRVPQRTFYNYSIVIKNQFCFKSWVSNRDNVYIATNTLLTKKLTNTLLLTHALLRDTLVVSTGLRKTQGTGFDG